VKANVLFGKFIDQSLHLVERVKARAPWNFIDAPPPPGPHRLRTTVLGGDMTSFNCFLKWQKPVLDE